MINNMRTNIIITFRACVFLHLLQVIPSKGALVLLVRYPKFPPETLGCVHLGPMLLYFGDEVVAHRTLVHPIGFHSKFASIPKKISYLHYLPFLYSYPVDDL